MTWSLALRSSSSKSRRVQEAQMMSPGLSEGDSSGVTPSELSLPVDACVVFSEETYLLGYWNCFERAIRCSSKMRKQNGLLLLPVLLVTALNLIAHHVIDGAYDISKTVSIRGTVAKIEVRNPHIHVYVDTTNPDGTVTHWDIETFAPQHFADDPLRLDMKTVQKNLFLRAGDTISADVYVSTSKPNQAAGRRWILQDGRTIEERHAHKVNGILETY